MISELSNEFTLAIFNYFVIGWFIIYIILCISIYLKSFKPYKTEFQDEFYTKIPSDVNIVELSNLINRKINANTLSAYIIKLINQDKLRIENIDDKDCIVRGRSMGPISIGDEATIKLLLSIMGDDEKVVIDDLENFCDRKKNKDILLMEYQIWCKIMMKENYRHIYYETKDLYGFVKLMFALGCLTFLYDIIINLGDIIGFSVLTLSIILLFSFTKCYKRTKEANEEYKKWIAFKAYLENIESFNTTIEDTDKYIEYGVCLGVKDLEKKLTNHTYCEKIQEAINKNVIKAILSGNRSL